MLPLHKRIEQCHQVCLRHHTTLPIQHLTIAEDHQGWYRANVILRCHIIVDIHIHLDNAELIPHRLLQILQYWVHHLARLAPCGKEINQNQLIARYYIIECLHYLLFLCYYYCSNNSYILYSLFVYKTTTSYENYQTFSPFYSFRMNIFIYFYSFRMND